MTSILTSIRMRKFKKTVNPQQVFNIVRRLSDDIDLVSFDVFDTLILRKVAPPERTKEPAAKAVSRLVASYGINVTAKEAFEKRTEMEQFLARQSVASGMDYEWHIVPLCQAWLEAYLGAELAGCHASSIVRVELEAEKAVCYPTPGMLQVVEQLRELVTRVVCISDMYLGKEIIDQLLDQCGYGRLFHNCYVSGDHKLSKRDTGRLYNLMLSEENVDPRRWIHIGDNREHDFLMTKRLNGHAYHFMPREQKLRTERFARLEALATNNPAWAGAEMMEFILSWNSPQAKKGLVYELGSKLFGPVLVNFVHRSLERIAQERVRLALLPAREGFILRDIFLKLQPQVRGAEDVESKYCFLNRKTVYLASVDHIGAREILAGLSATKQPSLRTMLTRFSLDIELFHEIAEECGIGDFDRRLQTPLKDFGFLKFIRHPKVRRLIEEQHRTYSAILADYLDELGFWDTERVAMVDVGWMGTVQDALTCAFQDRRDWPRLFGLYMGFLGVMPFTETSRSTYEGILADYRTAPPGYYPFERFRCLFEFVTRSPHPTTIGLQRDPVTDKIVPVLKPLKDPGCQEECGDQALVTGLQEGIMDFTTSYCEALPFVSTTPANHTPFLLEMLGRFLRFPRKNDGLAFQGSYHAEDFGVNPQSVVFKNRGDSHRSIRSRFSDFLGDIQWKEGYLGFAGDPGDYDRF